MIHEQKKHDLLDDRTALACLGLGTHRDATGALRVRCIDRRRGFGAQCGSSAATELPPEHLAPSSGEAAGDKDSGSSVQGVPRQLRDELWLLEPGKVGHACEHTRGPLPQSPHRLLVERQVGRDV